MAELAEPVVSFLLESITNLLVEEGKFLHGVKDQAEELQSDLKLMQSLLKDVDARRDEAAVIREWISQSKDLSYEAENSLETFAFKIASRRGGGIANVLKRFSCIVNECYLRHKIGAEIQSLSTRVSNLTRRFQDYGIRSIVEKGGSSSSHQQQQMIRRAYSHVEEDDFVGLESDVNMLMQHLVSQDEAISPFGVVSICGMGGLGKTTIARKVYNHPNVRHHFDDFAWVCISQEWQTKDILQGILVKIIPEKRKEIVKHWRDEELVRKLYEVQQNKRCLIVLDDIWSTNVWDCIKFAFPTGERSRSKILLTTRNKDVAIHIGPNGFHHEPRLLSHDESWELLRKKALRERYAHGHGSDDDTHRLQELGAEMIKYCGGLPLAVVVLGGLLATKHEFKEWKFVYQNIKSFLGKSETIGERGVVEKILALSYEDLPYQLKPCFLYLSIYPEDSDIEAETLYQLWMAEGMVSEGHRIGEESMMDIAERYLGELVKRCIVQVELKGGGIRKFKYCRLHDLMRDLCLSKAKDENFLKVIDYREGNINNESLRYSTNSSSRKLHRLVIFMNEEDVVKYVPPKKEMIENVRSLTFLRLGDNDFEGLASTKFNNFKMLRALTIEGLSLNPDKDKLLDVVCVFIEMFKLEIGNLIHLRYLCLRNSFFGMLPSSLGNLEHLETLDLRDLRVGFIRNVLWKMRKLRYLYLPDDKPLLDGCKVRLVGLNNLEILVNFNTKYCEVNDVHKLSNLEVLEAIAYKEKEWEEIIKFVSNSHCLKQASLYFGSIDDHSEKWTSLVEKLFHSNVRHLRLCSYLGVLPAEYKPNFFRNLLELELRWSRIERDLMGTLEKLPNLQRLWLERDAFVGTEIICRSTGFPQLRFLLLSELDKLKTFEVENGAMPNLTRLEISCCEKLEKIPDGLRYSSMLKELVITEMPQRFNERVREGGEDFEQVRHIPSILTSQKSFSFYGENELLFSL